jgi:hypothetical protein
MIGALLAQLQEAMHKIHLVYDVRVKSVGCSRVERGVRSNVRVTVHRRYYVR